MVSQLKPRHIVARDEWVLNIDAEPIIEWQFSRLDQGVLSPGRFFYIPTAGLDDSRVEKPFEFISSAKKLFGWLRRQTQMMDTEWGAERVGPITAELLRTGAITLRANPAGRPTSPS